jgi:hypothetical protein
MRYLLLAFLLLGASECAHLRIVPDTTPVGAQEANDATVIIEGCGNQPVSGYTYCRVTEGGPTTGILTLIAPPALCKEESCVFFKIFFTNGEPALGLSVPRGQMRVSIPWSDVVKRDTFLKDDRGFWPVLMETHWVDNNGLDRITFTEGEIRMRVLSKDYISLSSIQDDPNFQWTWSDDRARYKMTSAGRVWVGL